ncbi:DUF881 domain-containing protein [Nocardioides panaciterrulae]|uniref:Uncharacterized protein YlxW (UPF0749 family) n=1 Tax=Nocardioides panaciterrulae TaxID=661492 RepID=A0A7Y9JAK9_9ACTN|nr:DUF881 domain-containing protein [Nocardioides panaciterrulae]NYD41950.1 uncharacterized protein YlxW (UPF0749 family) [Nocardioides panaciterrulae]
MPDREPERGQRPEPPLTGRQRLLRAMRRPSRAQAVVAVLLAVVGFAAVTQVRATEVDNSYAGLREQDLIDVLNGLAGATQRAETEIARLESTRRDLQTSTDNRQAALAQAQERADTLAIMAGLVPVTGPGIRVTVTENGAPVDVNTILDTMEELRAAGAEAMQFNGKVRVVAQTAVEPAPGGIYVDGHLLTAPYVIDAIGDPHNLTGGMTFPEGPRQQFESDGQSVQIEQLQSLDIESTVDATAPDFAQPDTSQ